MTARSYLKLIPAQQTNYSLINLLPQSPSAIISDQRFLTNILKLTAKTITELIKTIHLFYVEQGYNQFDPHVGDNACQIRAAIIVMYLRSKPESYTLPERIQELENIRDDLINYLLAQEDNISKKRNRSESIASGLTNLDASIYITETEWFLYQARFLTLSKRYHNNTNQSFIDLEKIQLQFGLSRKFAKKLVRFYQLNLAKYSCEKVEMMASHSGNSNDLLSISWFDQVGRAVLPCYLSTKIILQQLINQKSPILVIIKLTSQSNTKLFLQFKINTQSGSYQYSPIDKKTRDPVFVVSGLSTSNTDPKNLIKQFLSLGFESILLANLSTHSQFGFTPDTNLDLYKHEPALGLKAFLAELADMNKIAIHQGCCAVNSSLFLAQHIFCSSLEAELFDIEEKKQILVYN